jgi:4-amino-4-deoxy-L-arabinose transferase-like glycosyltransferase
MVIFRNIINNNLSNDNMPEKEITVELKKPETIILLGLLITILILEIRVTLPSPIAFGDEGFHIRMAQYIAENKEYPVWVPFYDTKIFRTSFSRPPLWNILQGSFYLIFGFSETLTKILTPFIASILTGLIIFLIGKKIYNKKIGFIASLIGVTIPSFVTYSVLFYTDILFTFYFTLFALSSIMAIKDEKKKYWVVSGVFGAFALLTKTPGYAIFPFLILVFIYQIYKKNQLSGLIKDYLIIILIIVIISGPYFLRSYVYYNTPSCALTLFSGAKCSISFDYKNEAPKLPSGPAANVLQDGLMNYIFFAYGINQIGPFIFPFVFFGFLCGLAVMSYKREKTDIVLILSLISFIPLLLYISTGRGEDTARYTLSLVPIIALVSANYYEKVYNFIESYKKVVALVIFVLVIFFSFMNISTKLNDARHYDTNSQQYVGYKMFSPSFFQATDFIKRNTTKDVLITTIWDSQTAYNSQRNVIALRILPDSDDIMNSGNINTSLSRLKAHGITHIFVQKFSISDQYYTTDFVKFLESNGKNFVKIYENGPSVDECIKAGGCDGNILYEIKYDLKK